MRKPLVAGNWKMQGSLAKIDLFMPDFLSLLAAQAIQKTEIVLCPPFVYLASFSKYLKGAPIQLGAQNVHFAESGAYTGEISANMLFDLACQYVIIGHSERRQNSDESVSLILKKILAAQAQSLLPIICVGETQAEKAADQTFKVITGQLEVLFSQASSAFDWGHWILSYEPVWAIGTGLSATPEQAQAVHAFMRAELEKRDTIKAQRIRLLYGGSVKPENASALFSMPDIDGGLIGGASLKPDDFFEICKAAEMAG